MPEPSQEIDADMSDTATQTSTTDPAKPDASATQPSTNGTPAPGTDPAKTDELGPGGKAALDKERRDRADAEAERDRLATELEELKTKSMTDAEKAVEQARREGENDATAKANRRIAESEIRVAAAGKITNPDDAVALLGDVDKYIKRGAVDSDAIKSAIDDLVKAKPYLAAAGTAAALPGGGATQPTGKTMSDAIREQLSRRR